MAQHNALRLIVLIFRQHDIHPIRQGLFIRKGFQRFPPHHKHISRRFLTKIFHICGNALQKVSVLANTPVCINGNNYIHVFPPYRQSNRNRHTPHGFAVLVILHNEIVHGEIIEILYLRI